MVTVHAYSIGRGTSHHLELLKLLTCLAPYCMVDEQKLRMSFTLFVSHWLLKLRWVV